MSLKLRERAEQAFEKVHMFTHSHFGNTSVAALLPSQLQTNAELQVIALVAEQGAAVMQLQVPATIMYATGKEGCGVRKPETGMWDFFVAHLNDGVQPG